MPSWNLPTADASPAFRALDELTTAFIEAAVFDATAGGASPSLDEFFTEEHESAMSEGTADGTIPGDADASSLPDDELSRVASFVADLRTRLGPHLDAACERPGYDMERAGHDLYWTVTGSGVGFWSRDELSEGDPKSLGDVMSDLVGRGEISMYATKEGDDSYIVRFDCLYTSGAK